MDNIQRLKVSPTEGEMHLVEYLKNNLDDTYEVFFNPFLDGDRPDIIILRKGIGAFVIEVKDWDLHHYDVDYTNQWYVNSKIRSKISSPQSQSFRYKKNMYDLHLPVVGLARLTNSNFYNLVHCFVYFHKASIDNIKQIYSAAELELSEKQKELNMQFKSGQIPEDNYNVRFDFIYRKKKQIQRDKNISISNEKLASLIKKIKSSSEHILFDDNVYKDFKRRLSPSDNTLKQGIKIKFDNKQLAQTLSNSGKSKVKGVAGCGKTSILAQRTVNAISRHNSETLILTFNITLKNYIRDKLSDILGCRAFNLIEISNYHQFYNSQLNNTGQDILQLAKHYGMSNMYNQNLFLDFKVTKYKTIFIDEIQDYKPDWVKIIRDNFLDSDGEMVLFGDESQDIYHRNSGRAQVIAQGFGRWNKLTRSYRTDFDSPLNQLFVKFQLEYLAEKSDDLDIFDISTNQMGIGFSLLKYKCLNSHEWVHEVYEEISSIISSYELVPNDIVIISSSIYNVRKLNEILIKFENTSCMFDTYDELAENLPITKDKLLSFNELEINDFINGRNEYREYTRNKEIVERIRRAKKNHFYSNSGLIKLSTVHSFKGLEAKTVFYLLNEDDDPEMIYTAITRTTENLVILDLNSKNKCSEFFLKSVK